MELKMDWKKFLVRGIQNFSKGDITDQQVVSQAEPIVPIFDTLPP